MHLAVVGAIVFFVAACIFAIPCVKKSKEYRRLMPLIEDPDAVRIAILIHLNAVNGQIFTGRRNHYWTDIKKGAFNSEPVGVALFEPGEYRFTVSSNDSPKYKNIDIEVLLEPGITYQLGCTKEGPYLVPDPDPCRYDYYYR